MTEFSGRVAVVTGAGSGIGRALALALAARGARLAISDIDEAAVAATAVAIKAAATGAGTEVEPARLDVSDRDAVFAYADAVAARFGSVNLVVNNAGVAISETVAEMAIEDFEWLMGINFWGVVYGSKAFLPKLIESGDGHLVNISSTLGMIAAPELSAYCAAKFAVRGFTEALRQELLIAQAPVAVSCVHPGGVKTGIARAARSREHSPDELAASFDKIAFLSPEKAAAIILRGVQRRRPRILVGADAYLLQGVERVLGACYQQLFARATARMR
jgi:NAD(P)-dependent dehydrogenase (short-subunit alcohol dehydrogenase family)